MPVRVTHTQTYRQTNSAENKGPSLFRFAIGQTEQTGQDIGRIAYAEPFLADRL